MKALEIGDEAVAWESIEVTCGTAARPSIALRGEAARLASRRGVRSLSLSLTRQRNHAAAVVLMEAER